MPMEIDVKCSINFDMVLFNIVCVFMGFCFINIIDDQIRFIYIHMVSIYITYCKSIGFVWNFPNGLLCGVAKSPFLLK